MALRLYRTTRPRFHHVVAALQTLHVLAAVGGHPTAFGLLALYVTGLVLLDTRQTRPRISEKLPARCHDALNRLLRVMPLSTRALMTGLIAFARHLSRRLGTLGYLCVDDVVIEQPFARLLPWAAWTYSHAKQQKVYGVHVVLRSWASDPTGTWRIPGGLPALASQTLLCAGTLSEEDGPGRDHAAGSGGRRLSGRLPGGRHGLHRRAGQQDRHPAGAGLGGHHRAPHDRRLSWAAAAGPALGPTLKLKWRPKLGVRAISLSVYAPALGPVRLVVLKHEHGNFEYLVTNDLACDLALLVRRQRSRWRIETIFRDTKQLAGLAACQCWVDQALVRHVALVFLAFVVLQVLRRAPQETVGVVKARWQGEVLRDGQTPPLPLRAAPPAFRIK